MRTILIDPEAQTVEELDFKGDYKKIQMTIGCSCFTSFNIDGPDYETIYVDDEGLLQPSGFVFEYQGHPLVGRGLIMGCDDEGASIGTTLNLDDVKDNIQFRGERAFNA